MPPTTLYAIADTQMLGEGLLPAVNAALKGGCGWVQYRDKTTDINRRLFEARELLRACHEWGAQLIINDDPELAKRIGADGVHLGQTDGDPAYARALLGARAIIGVTCHDSLPLALAAREAGASYVAFGRFFRSQTKPEAPPAPLNLLKEARTQLGRLPIVAIGGITVENGGELISAGADRLAVSYGLFSAPDIAARARAFNASAH